MSKSTEDRDALHRLIDKLRPEDIGTAQRVLQALNASDDPLLTALRNAPADDEAESDTERAASERARREIEEGRRIRTMRSGESCAASELADRPLTSTPRR